VYACHPISPQVFRRKFSEAASATLALNLTHRALAAPAIRVSILVDASDRIASSAPADPVRQQLFG